MMFLKQSTGSQSVKIGPFVDSTDAITAETGLTIASTDIKLSKAGGTIGNKNSGGGTHDAGGWYTITLDATDTATVGTLQLSVSVTGAMPVWHEFHVVEEAVYDGLFAASATGIFLSAATIADAVLDEAMSGHTTAGTLGKAVADIETNVTAILADTGTDGVVVAAGSKTGYSLTATTGLGNQTANITGTITTATNVTTVNGLAANVITAASIATDAIDADALAADAIAEINATVDTALADIHLDHLLATDYDPASKPGTATALLNELIESNGGVSRYTAAALAQAPSGTGGDATAANQTTILNHLTDIKGGTFSGATDSLEAIRDRGDSAWTTGAGGSDRLLMVDTTIATLGSQTNFTLTSGSADNDAYNGCTIVIEDASTATQKAVGVVSDYVGSTRTVTLIADPAVFTMAASDKVYILAERSVKSSSASSFFINAGDVASEASVQSVDTAVGNILSALPTNFVDMAISATTGYVIAASVQGNVTGSVASVSGAVGSVTGAVGSVTGNVGGNVTGSVGSVLGGINTTSGVITTLDALDTAQDTEHNATQATLAALNNLSAAQVNAEVVDALATDTYAEPGQGAPAATASLAAKINYLYKAWRNKKTQTATALNVFADDGTTVDQKSTVSDDGTTATVGEIASGP